VAELLPRDSWSVGICSSGWKELTGICGFTLGITMLAVPLVSEVDVRIALGGAGDIVGPEG